MSLVIAIVLAAVVEIGLSTYSQSRSQILDTRVFQTYESLSALITNNLVTFPNNGSVIPLPDTIRTSLNQGNTNQPLVNCVIGSNVASCQDGLPQPLTLYFPILQSGNQPIMAGPGPAGAAGSAPARFDVYGNSCSSATWTRRCPFEIYAQFTPSCGGPAVCNRAVSISVHFQLRGPRSGSYLASGNENNLPVVDLVSSAISVNAILPPTPDQIAEATKSNKQVKQYSNSDTTVSTAIDWSSVNPAIVAGLSSNSDPADAAKIAEALMHSGVTDPTILKTLALAGFDSAADAKAVAAAITTAGISDSNIIGVLVQGWVENATQAGQVASELTASGVSFDSLAAQVTLGALVHYDVTNPVTLAAMFNTLTSLEDLGDYYGAASVAKTGVTDPAQISAIIQQVAAQSSTTVSSTTASSSTSGSDGSSGSAAAGPLAPPPFQPIHTCSGAQCSNSVF